MSTGHTWRERWKEKKADEAGSIPAIAHRLIDEFCAGRMNRARGLAWKRHYDASTPEGQEKWKAVALYIEGIM